MDTTGMSRPEIDALRELAAKAHEEGRRMEYSPILRSRDDGRTLAREAREWAAEELPYPKATRNRVVVSAGARYERPPGPSLAYVGNGLEPWVPGPSIADLKALASLLTRDELLAIAEGPCGPIEEVDAE